MKKRQVVEYALSLPNTASREKLAKLRFPNILTSRRLNGWIRSYFKYKWDKVPAKEAQYWKECPDWWKHDVLKMPTGMKKGRDPSHLLPGALGREEGVFGREGGVLRRPPPHAPACAVCLALEAEEG